MIDAEGWRTSKGRDKLVPIHGRGWPSLQIGRGGCNPYGRGRGEAPKMVSLKSYLYSSTPKAETSSSQAEMIEKIFVP